MLIWTDVSGEFGHLKDQFSFHQIIEAMAAGCPVVATPNPGAREVLADGAFARIVDDADLGYALVDLLEDPEARADLTERGRERARGYDWSVVVDEYERIYESLLR